MIIHTYLCSWKDWYITAADDPSINENANDINDPFWQGSDWTEQKSSVRKFTFLVNFELNLVQVFAEGTWTELSSLIEWTWTKMNRKVQFIFLL